MNVSSGNNTYMIVFVRNEYSSLIVLKTQKFVTLAQYLDGILSEQIFKNNIE